MTVRYCVCKVEQDDMGKGRYRTGYQTEIESAEEFAALVNENKAEWDFLIMGANSFGRDEMYFEVMMKRKGE